MNEISNRDSSSAELNLNINNTYDLVNDDSNTTDFGENDASNSEAVPSSSESQKFLSSFEVGICITSHIYNFFFGLITIISIGIP
jgi:hypothetical protein